MLLNCCQQAKDLAAHAASGLCRAHFRLLHCCHKLRLTFFKTMLKRSSPCRAHIQALDRSVSKAEADWEASVQRRVSGAAKQAAVWQDAAAAVTSLQQGLQKQAAAVAERAAKVRQLRQHLCCRLLHCRMPDSPPQV